MPWEREPGLRRVLPTLLRTVIHLDTLMNTWQRALLILLVLVSCIGCDQVSKDMAQENLRFARPVELLGGMLHLYYAENTGVAFSLGAELSRTVRYWLFTVGAGVVLIGLFLYALLRRKSTRWQLVAYALMIGGGVSNLLDRLFNDGRVIDFMMIKVGAVHTAIFNLADVMILSGCGLLVAVLWRPLRESDAAAAAEAAAKKAAGEENDGGEPGGLSEG